MQQIALAQVYLCICGGSVGWLTHFIMLLSQPTKNLCANNNKIGELVCINLLQANLLLEAASPQPDTLNKLKAPVPRQIILTQVHGMKRL